MNRKHTPLRTRISDCIMWEMSKNNQHTDGKVIYELNEPLDENDLCRSIENLTKLIPVLVGKPQFGLWCGTWIFNDHPDISNLVVHQRAGTEEETAHLFNEAVNDSFDVEKDCYIRVTSINGPTRYYLIVHIHHLAMDGSGIVSLLEHFTHCYRKLREDAAWVPEKPLNMERSHWQIAKNLKWKQIFNGVRLAMQQTEFDARHSVILGDFSAKTDTDTVGKPHITSLCIASPDFKKVARFVREAGYTINDLLLATQLSAVYHWNKDRGQDSSTVRTSFSFDLRRWGQPEGTFANYSDSDMIVEKSENLGDMLKAIESVSSSMQKMKPTLGLKTFGMVLISSPIPEYLIRRKMAPLVYTELRKILGKSNCLSNVGILPESIGDFGYTQALSCSIAGVLSPMPNVFMVATTYKDNLTINMRFDADYMKPETADLFLGLWKQRMMSLISRLEK